MSKFKVGDVIRGSSFDPEDKNFVVTHILPSRYGSLVIAKNVDGEHYRISEGSYELAPLADGYYLGANSLYRIKGEVIEYWRFETNGGWVYTDTTAGEIRKSNMTHLGPISENDEE
jgi:hypothetical protein